MTRDNETRVVSRERWIDHPQGRLFAREWTPADGAAEGARAGATPEPPPIVLLHDSLGCVDLWRDFPARLSAATGRRVLAWDRLGFGRSDPRAGRLPMDFIADEAKRFFPHVRAALGGGRFVAFGHSVGGGMAVHCAAAAGAGCAALITESAQAFAEEKTLAGVRQAKEEFRDAKQFERLTRYHGDKARWVLDAWTDTWLDPDFATWSLAPVLPRVGCPVLAIHGVDDEFGSPRHPELIGRACTGPTRVELLAGTRHVPHRERPAAVAGLVADFLMRRG